MNLKGGAALPAPAGRDSTGAALMHARGGDEAAEEGGKKSPRGVWERESISKRGGAGQGSRQRHKRRGQ